MIVKVKFDLNDEDDKFNYKLFNQSRGMFFVLLEVKDLLRKILKYETLDDITEAKVEEIRDLFFQSMDEHGVNLDE